MSTIKLRLQELGIALPAPVAPAANYVPYRWAGNLLFVSGQVPTLNGVDQFSGRVGEDLSIEEGQKAARLCAINILAQVNAALNGDLERIQSCVKLGGFVNCASGFGAQPSVINGASDFFVEVLGDRGRHARFAVGSVSLPRNVAVEVDGIFECRLG
jgi:enamine deaminase RidA (YjgF/YER057c/UK114 family)